MAGKRIFPLLGVIALILIATSLFVELTGIEKGGTPLAAAALPAYLALTRAAGPALTRIKKPLVLVLESRA